MLFSSMGSRNRMQTSGRWAYTECTRIERAINLSGEFVRDRIILQNRSTSREESERYARTLTFTRTAVKVVGSEETRCQEMLHRKKIQQCKTTHGSDNSRLVTRVCPSLSSSGESNLVSVGRGSKCKEGSSGTHYEGLLSRGRTNGCGCCQEERTSWKKQRSEAFLLRPPVATCILTWRFT